MALRDFYHDKETRKEVQDYLSAFLDAEVLKKVYKGEDVKPIGEAKAVLEKAFENLDTIFASKLKKKKVMNNPAR